MEAKAVQLASPGHGTCLDPSRLEQEVIRAMSLPD